MNDKNKFKVIFLGDPNVGKSSILNRYSKDKFEDNYQATIGIDFFSEKMVVYNREICLMLYDTAGQEKYESLIPMYIRDAKVVIVVYDITSYILTRKVFTYQSSQVDK